MISETSIDRLDNEDTSLQAAVNPSDNGTQLESPSVTHTPTPTLTQSPSPTQIFKDTSVQQASTSTLTSTKTKTPTYTPTPRITASAKNSFTSTLTPTAISTSTWTPLPPSTQTLTSSPTTTKTQRATIRPTVTPTLHLSGDYVPGEVLIKVDIATSLSELSAYLNAIDADIVSEITEFGIIHIRAFGLSVEELIVEIDSLPGVVYVEPNYRTRLLETIPNDPGWSNQYGMDNIRAPGGWELATGSVAVTIAVLDTGVDLSHPDLSAKITSGFDFVENDTNPQDDNGHGTHVAGIAAATTNNSIGVAGTSWGAQVMPIKIMNRDGNGSYSDLAAGVIWAADHGADVINMSLGGGSPSALLEDAVNYAYARGVVQVAAAGNTGSGNILYPARYTHVIAVGATDANNNRASFSNYGAELDLVAPGVSIYSTRLGGSYGYRNGTSMSTPYVSGLAAILIGLSRPYSPDLIAYEMQSTALDRGATGWDSFYGHGLIQMDAALAEALPTATPTTLPGGQDEQEDSEDTDDSEKAYSATPSTSADGIFALGQGVYEPTKTRTSTPSPTSSWTPTPGDSIIALLSITGTSTPTETPSPKPSISLTVEAPDEGVQKPPSLIILGVFLIAVSVGLFGYGLLLRRLNQTE